MGGAEIKIYENIGLALGTGKEKVTGRDCAGNSSNSLGEVKKKFHLPSILLLLRLLLLPQFPPVSSVLPSLSPGLRETPSPNEVPFWFTCSGYGVRKLRLG